MFPSRAVWWRWAVMLTLLSAAALGHAEPGTAAAGLAMAAAAVVLAGCVGTVRLTAVCRAASALPAVRDRHHRTVFMPQCDPDADGRPRPRAPGA